MNEHSAFTPGKTVTLLMHPMFLVILTGLVFGNTAIWTLAYDPGYLPYSEVWSIVALSASLAAYATVRWMAERVAVVTGAVIVVTAFARAAANLWQSFALHEVVTDAATLRVSAGVWLLLAVLIYTIWTRLVLPWVVLSRRGMIG